MMDLLILGAVVVGTYFFLKTIWNYQMQLAKVSRK